MGPTVDEPPLLLPGDSGIIVAEVVDGVLTNINALSQDIKLGN
jgi:hypothetical protein